MMNNENQDIFGLVLAGGQSKRMGKDKTLLVYADKPQYECAYELLQKVCARVFVSTRNDKATAVDFGNYPCIYDQPEFCNKGPVSGIMSAMSAYPEVSWLVLACDLPFVTVGTLRNLFEKRSRGKLATAYKSEYDGLPEPLCAVWEKGHLQQMLGYLQQGISCPRKILIKAGAHLLEVSTAGELDNINDPAEAARAIARIRSGK